MDFNHSPRTQDYLKRLNKFMRKQVDPIEERYLRDNLTQNGSPDYTKWSVLPIVKELQAAAKAEGL